MQGVVLRDAGIPEAGLLGVGEVEVFGGGREGEGEAVFRVVDLVVLRAGARGAGWGEAAREGGRGAARGREQQGGHGVAHKCDEALAAWRGRVGVEEDCVCLARVLAVRVPEVHDLQ